MESVMGATSKKTKCSSCHTYAPAIQWSAVKANTTLVGAQMMYSSCQFAARLMGTINIAWIKQLDAIVVPSSLTVVMLLNRDQRQVQRDRNGTAKAFLSEDDGVDDDVVSDNNGDDDARGQDGVKSEEDASDDVGNSKAESYCFKVGMVVRLTHTAGVVLKATAVRTVQ